MNKVLDDAKALVTEIEAEESGETVVPTVTSVVLNYSDGTSTTLSPPAVDVPAETDDEVPAGMVKE